MDTSEFYGSLPQGDVPTSKAELEAIAFDMPGLAKAAVAT